MRERNVYRGRFAPSPTGLLHLGSAQTALAAWLRARVERGTFVLRIEDLDPPRIVRGAAEAIALDLRWLGLDWDEGPDVGGPHAPYVQSERLARYDEALSALEARELLYPCTCSRKDILSMASAPHGLDDEGPRYPGICRNGPTQPERPASLRFRMDELAGADDFVVRRADGLHSYQLAVVVDDIAMRITEVVRGEDLLSSMPRQIALHRALGHEPPVFLHAPLVRGPDGTRLSKRHGSISIRDRRDAGEAPERVVGALAGALGLAAPGEGLMPADLVERVARDPKRALR